MVGGMRYSFRVKNSAGRTSGRTDMSRYEWACDRKRLFQLQTDVTFALLEEKAAGRSAMATIESTPQRRVLQSGSTKLTLDKEAGKVSVQRKVLF
jgi:hypothetical protein